VTKNKIKKKASPEYFEGTSAQKKFEQAMKALFRAAKASKKGKD